MGFPESVLGTSGEKWWAKYPKRFDTADDSFADVTTLARVRTTCAGVQEQC